MESAALALQCYWWPTLYSYWSTHRRPLRGSPLEVRSGWGTQQHHGGRLLFYPLQGTCLKGVESVVCWTLGQRLGCRTEPIRCLECRHQLEGSKQFLIQEVDKYTVGFCTENIEQINEYREWHVSLWLNLKLKCKMGTTNNWKEQVANSWHNLCKNYKNYNSLYCLSIYSWKNMFVGDSYHLEDNGYL